GRAGFSGRHAGSSSGRRAMRRGLRAVNHGASLEGHFPREETRMPPHSIGSGTISFGLVSIPVKMFTAASSESGSFNQIHPKGGGRIKQQLLCPTCNEIVERNALVKGYEFAKDQYVQFTEEELKALEGESSRMIDIAEFVPLAQVDPIYFEKTYYLGP